MGSTKNIILTLRSMADESDIKKDGGDGTKDGDGDKTKKDTGDGGDGSGSDGGDDGGDKGKDDNGKKKEDTVPHKMFHSERERRKTAEAKLKDFEDKATEKAEESKKKKGEFKTLFEAAKEKNISLQEQITGLTEKVTGFEEASTKRITDSIDKLQKEEDKETVKEILEGKSLSEQESLLPKILTKFSLPENVNKGVDEGDGKGGKEDIEAKRQEAREKNNSLAAIKSAKVVE